MQAVICVHNMHGRVVPLPLVYTTRSGYRPSEKPAKNSGGTASNTMPMRPTTPLCAQRCIQSSLEVLRSRFRPIKNVYYGYSFSRQPIHAPDLFSNNNIVHFAIAHVRSSCSSYPSDRNLTSSSPEEPDKYSKS